MRVSDIFQTLSGSSLTSGVFFENTHTHAHTPHTGSLHKAGFVSWIQNLVAYTLHSMYKLIDPPPPMYLEHKGKGIMNSREGASHLFLPPFRFSDRISASSPRVVGDARARALCADMKRCSYYETCATYGLNVDRVFQEGECGNTSICGNWEVMSREYCRGPVSRPLMSDRALASVGVRTETGEPTGGMVTSESWGSCYLLGFSQK